jgi:Iap family predicted aminopeptidase
MRKYLTIGIILLLFISNAFSQSKDIWKKLIGSAYIDGRGYEVMGKICDEIGPRLMGSANFDNAVTVLKNELLKDNLVPVDEKFNTLGWVRGDDELLMLQPTQRNLKITAVGYVNKHPKIKANLVYVGNGSEDNIKNNNVKGKIILVAREGNFGKGGPSAPEIINNAIDNGAEAVLFYNSEQPGFLAIAKSGNFVGDTIKIPVFNMTYEEGSWLKRLWDQRKTVELQITTNSYCKQIQTGNLVLTIPGKVKQKIVVGAHLDSWDLGQGAVDNGLGSAIIFDVARMIKRNSPENYYTIEFVWFTGEEMGLIGSKNYVRMHKADPIIAYVNFDMTGYPIGFNTMGFDEYYPFLENLVNNLKGFDLKDGVKSNPGLGSDHVHFMMAGIPTLYVSGQLDEIMYKYYHEYADTWDKINKKYISQAVAVSTIMIYELANSVDMNHRNYSEKEMIDMLKSNKLDEPLKKSGEWIYKE